MKFPEMIEVLDQWNEILKTKTKFRDYRNILYTADLPEDLIDEMWDYVFTKNKSELYDCYRNYKSYQKVKKINIYEYKLRDQ